LRRSGGGNSAASRATSRGPNMVSTAWPTV
jgi:hypothetical protein